MKKHVIFLLTLSLFICIGGYYGIIMAADETITISTYYPAPYGVYRQMRITDTRGTDILIKSQDSNVPGNPVIALTSTNTTVATGLRPSITFQNDAGTTPDFRIALRKDNDLEVKGGAVSFTNDNSTYSRIRVGEIWVCSGNVTF